jgi:hypothetical protein
MISKISNFSGPSSTLFKIGSTASGWQILMMYTGKKTTSANWVGASFNSLRISMASPGTGGFATASSSSVSTNAISRTKIGDGQGVYDAFFTQKNITKIAFIDGTGTLEPTTNSNYLVYNLVESTGSESIYDILKRLDEYQRTSTSFATNDTVWGTSSVRYHTAGVNGYSGLLVATGGNGFRDNSNSGLGNAPKYPDKFVVLGINRDSDNDIQALAAFSGNLNTGKGDVWRNDNPLETFWSYWGNDFHTNSQTQRPSGSLQTAPGVSTGAFWTQSVYLIGYS